MGIDMVVFHGNLYGGLIGILRGSHGIFLKDLMGFRGIYPPANIKIAIGLWPLSWLIHLNMVVFHSNVGLPEGNGIFIGLFLLFLSSLAPQMYRMI